MRRMAVAQLACLLSCSLNTLIVSADYSVSGRYMALDGNNISFSSFEGDVMFVEVFGTQCGHCHVQHEELEEIWNEFQARLVMLSLADDVSSVSELQTYAASVATPWLLGWDEHRDFVEQFSVFGVPHMFLLNTEGDLVAEWRGRTSYETLAADISEYLACPSNYTQSPDDTGFLIPDDPIALALQLAAFSMVVYVAIVFVQDLRLKRWDVDVDVNANETTQESKEE